MSTIIDYFNSEDRAFVPHLKQAFYFSREDQWFVCAGDLLRLRLPHIMQMRGISICGLGQVDHQKTSLPAHIEDELKYFLSQQLFDCTSADTRIDQDTLDSRNSLNMPEDLTLKPLKISIEDLAVTTQQWDRNATVGLEIINYDHALWQQCSHIDEAMQTREHLNHYHADKSAAFQTAYYHMVLCAARAGDHRLLTELVETHADAVDWESPAYPRQLLTDIIDATPEQRMALYSEQDYTATFVLLRTLVPFKQADVVASPHFREHEPICNALIECLNSPT